MTTRVPITAKQRQAFADNLLAVAETYKDAHAALIADDNAAFRRALEDARECRHAFADLIRETIKANAAR